MPDEDGYIGIGPEAGNFASKSEAYSYDLERCLHGSEEDRKEFREMLVEWYYSGNWVRTE